MRIWVGMRGVTADRIGRWLRWVGVGAMVFGIGFGVRSWSYARTQLRAMATVTENVSGFAPGGGVVYRPKLRFRASDGEPVRVVVGQGDEDAEFGSGAAVPVMYPAGRPQDAVIATVWRVYRWAILFAVLGVVVFDAGLILQRLVAKRIA